MINTQVFDKDEIKAIQDALFQYEKEAQALRQELDEYNKKISKLRGDYFDKKLTAEEESLKEKEYHQLIKKNNEAIETKGRFIEELTHRLNHLSASLETKEKTKPSHLDYDKEPIPTIESGINISSNAFTTATNTSTVWYEHAAKNFLSVATNIVQPAFLIVAGLMSIKNIFVGLHDKALGQRKTKVATAGLTALASLAGIGVIFLAASNPIGLAVCILAPMVFELWKEGYSTSQTLAKINHEKKLIVEKQKELDYARQQYSDTDPRVKILAIQAARHQNNLTQLQENHFQNQRKTGFNLLYAAGGALLLGGVFFPPLLIAGAVVLTANALIDTVDQRTNFKFSRGMARMINGIAQKISKIWGLSEKKETPKLSPALKETTNLEKVQTLEIKHESEAMVFHALAKEKDPKEIVKDSLKTLHQESEKEIAPLEATEKSKNQLSSNQKNEPNEDEGEGEHPSMPHPL